MNKPFILSLILPLIAFCTSIVSIWLAILSYKRNRRFDNENHLYKIKIEKYHEVLISSSNLLSEIDLNLSLAQDYFEDRDSELGRKLEKAAIKIERQLFKFQFEIASLSLLFPKQIVKQLEEFLDHIFEIDVESEKTGQQEKNFQDCLDKIEIIESSMREDLHIDVLNSTLYKRIKK